MRTLFVLMLAVGMMLAGCAAPDAGSEPPDGAGAVEKPAKKEPPTERQSADKQWQ